MAASILYEQIYDLLDTYVDPSVDRATRERLTSLVLGLIHGKSVSPAHIARALDTLGLNNASAESWERRIRRTENDPEINAVTCLHPLIKHYLAIGAPNPLVLILDPTTKQDEVTMLALTLPYRGRALPVAWMVWPGNQPLEGEGFWERVRQLFQQVAPLLALGVPIVVLADGAFGNPAFTDLVASFGWHLIVRVQEQTRCLDRVGQERQIGSLVRYLGQRAKGHYQVFKTAGWRALQVFAFARRSPKTGKVVAFCLVTDLPAQWAVAHMYARRYHIEAGFRDYKSHGWEWESSQVKSLSHWQCLLVIMALGTWITLMVGTQMAREALHKARGRCRTSLPWEGKSSLFQLGLQFLDRLLVTLRNLPLSWELEDWDGPPWSVQIWEVTLHAYLFSDCSQRRREVQ